MKLYKLLIFISVLMMLPLVYGQADTLVMVLSDGNITFNSTIMNGTKVSCTDINVASGDACNPGGAGGGNSSFNESYTDTLYSNIIWGYNQTLATLNVSSVLFSDIIWGYNQTLQTIDLTNLLYADIIWGYNQTLATLNISEDLYVNVAGDNMSGPLQLNNNRLILDDEGNHFIKINNEGYPFNGITLKAIWRNHDDEHVAGTIAYLDTVLNKTLSWKQVARNNSYSGEGNSLGVVPNYWGQENFSENGIINMTKLSDYLVICDTFGPQFNVSCQFSADTIGRGMPLLFTGDLEVWLSARIHNGLRVDNDLNVILQNGNDIDVISGDIHLRKDRIQTLGVDVDAPLTRLYEDFESGILNNFILLTSGKGADEWSAVSDILCPDNGDFCSHAGPSGGSGDTIMQANFTTINTEDMNLTFNINTIEMASGGDFEITINNNSGGVETLYSLVGSNVVDSIITVPVPSSMNNISIVTMEFIFSSTHPVRGDVWTDNIKLNGTATANTLSNTTIQDGVLVLGEADVVDTCYVNVSGNFQNKTMNLVCNNVNIVGNVTQSKLTVASQNVTGDVEAQSFTLNGTTLLNWSDIGSFAEGIWGYNQTLQTLDITNTLYSDIIWGYNQTLQSIEYVDNQEFLTAGYFDQLLNTTNNVQYVNVTVTDCIIFDGGGKICSGV